MVYCAAYGCKNVRYKSRSKVDGRDFLRFYKFPKDPKLAQKWKVRIGRRMEDISEKMQICSDHFQDDDFRNITKIKNFFYAGMHITLTDTAIPNTDRESQSSVKSASSKRSRKRACRASPSMGAFIEEQEQLLQDGSSSQVDGSTTTGEMMRGAQRQSEVDGGDGVETSCTSCKCTCYHGHTHFRSLPLKLPTVCCKSWYS